MSERQRQSEFLKRLLAGGSTEQCLLLQEQVYQAERDEQCLAKAMRLVGLVGLLAVCGLGYEALFVEDFFSNPTLLMTRIFYYLVVGSALSLVLFAGYGLWQRAQTNRLHEECRRLLSATGRWDTDQFHALERGILPVPKQDTAATLAGHATSLPKAA